MRQDGTRNILWSADELRWVEANSKRIRREAHAEFCKLFREIKLSAYAALCKRKRWLTGRDGRIQKGNVPANKGKKMPFNAASAATQFKKGHRGGKARELYKPIGTERISIEGYIERKIHDGWPLQSRWRAVHLINWETLHGPLPKGHCLKCKNGDKGNIDPSNWELIPRGALPFLNGHRGHNYATVANEVKPSVIALAKLRHAVGAVKRHGRMDNK